MTNATFYQLADNISLTQVDEEVVLLNLNSGSYYGLNPIGAEFLNKLVANQSVEESCSALSERYSVSADTIKTDINELLEQLLTQGLIKQNDAE